MVLLPELHGDPQAPLLLLIQHTLQLQEVDGLESRNYFLLCLEQVHLLGVGLVLPLVLTGMVEVVAGRVLWGDHHPPGPGSGGRLGGPLETVESGSDLPGLVHSTCCRAGQIWHGKE